MLDSVWNEQRITTANEALEEMSAQDRIAWVLENLPGEFALSSSFGVQSAVSLHMVTQLKPDIPIILVDTGYLFPETYQFIEELTDRLSLNLKVFRSPISPAWQEARFGKLWEKGLDGLKQYNQLNKVEPMEQGLEQLNVSTWFAGVMRSQSNSRQNLEVLQKIRGRLKVHPLIDWNNRVVYQYLKKHNLPYHPLWEKGYVSIGDIHSTVPLSAGMSEEETRFGGLKRECGLHEDSLSGL
ncbi:phosphoadenylyl-sulfate reductase [Aliikangiella sp. G2MR2-5]|uniref:phosphoadenylyl-sulfate reductase n=1 Tax=Aliikangiella sp. G2MR2-5 TaxID=2788943 RepID=UPI001FEF0CC0|nr:phosphoadenylyl-sulfate reductase [Aliikangiella sp. G2MR2-5]